MGRGNEYTHLVRVGTGSFGQANATAYGVSIIAGIGDLSPTYFLDASGNQVPIQYLLSYTNSSDPGGYTVGLYMVGSIYSATVYLGRADTELFLGKENYSKPVVGIFRWKDVDDLFTNEDVGKVIPIWLASTEPSWSKATNDNLDYNRIYEQYS